MKSEDREKLREERAREREETRNIRDSFNLNIGNDADKFLAILQGAYRPPALPDEPDRITKQVNAADFSRGKKASAFRLPPDESDEGGVEMMSPQYFAAPQQQVAVKYAEIVQQLDRFQFSDDPEHQAEQMGIVMSAVRDALNKLIAKEVYTNTKKAFGEAVKSFIREPGGLKVVFSFGNRNVTVVAKGNFFGDETICVHALEGKIKAAVLKFHADGERYDDRSRDFEIVLGVK